VTCAYTPARPDDLEGVYGVATSGLCCLSLVPVSGVGKAVLATGLEGVFGVGGGSERELFSKTAASRGFASSSHRKKPHLVG